MIKRLTLISLLVAIVFGSGGFPMEALIDCEISKTTIDGIQNIINDHSSIIQLAKSNKRVKKTEIDSMKADIDTFMEDLAEDDKQKWNDCVMKKTTAKK